MPLFFVILIIFLGIKMKKILFILFIFLFCSVLSFAEPLKIAQVYSQMDDYQWKNTFDPYIGDSFIEKYEATEFDELAKKFKNYDLIIF